MILGGRVGMDTEGRHFANLTPYVPLSVVLLPIYVVESKVYGISSGCTWAAGWEKTSKIINF
jgi:hypothetical protein